MPRKPSAKTVAREIAQTTMYRGARVGDPRLLDGPSYFISAEIMARTYGPTAAFQLTLHKPLIVSDGEWLQSYANSPFVSLDEIVDEVEDAGYDSVVNVRHGPAGKLYVVLLLYPEQAELIEDGLLGCWC